ncbi:MULTISPECIES: hypothetical protein [Streptomyces]|uniref:hypothetical protein n=1 Tax=Streptomyces herbicida TaxID=3065675 RepID=UPI002930FEF5|nr:hypothetical protein [Streptomyces sp. NEAU-HV9]
MTSSFLPGTPVVPRGAIVLLDPATGAVLRVIALQYNPDTVTRTLQPQGVGAEAGERSEALRLKGPAHETVKVEVELNATDQLEDPSGADADVVARFGLLPVLAALDQLVNPTARALLDQDAAARSGAFEIAPMESPLTVFVWNRDRVVPVRITEFTVTEEAFDSRLQPIRAKVGLGLRILTIDDLGFTHRGGALFLAHQRRREQLAALHRSARPGPTILGTPPGGS